LTLNLIFTPFVMSALSAKARLKTVWEQVSSSLATAFVGLLQAVMTADLSAEAHAIRIQPSPDLACDQRQVELVSGSIAEVKQEPLALWVTVLPEWGTCEHINLRLTPSEHAKLVSPAGSRSVRLGQGTGAGLVCSNLAMQSAAGAALAITQAG
jgi:hypothetical protein